MRTHTIVGLIAVILLVPALSGCAKRDTTQVQVEQAAPANVRQIDVALTEWSITFNPESFGPGEVQFMIKNEGNAPHALQIEGQGINVRSDDMESGQSTTMMANLPAGTYRAWCPIGNHAGRGMDMQLVVK